MASSGRVIVVATLRLFDNKFLQAVQLCCSSARYSGDIGDGMPVTVLFGCGKRLLKR